MTRVECRDLHASAGDTSLLEGVSLSLTEPAFIGILGPNGAGKSTLLRILAGYRRPDRGQVLWDGRPLKAWPAAERGATCGYLSQQFEPAWNYSVEEIITLGLDRKPGIRRPLAEIVAEHGIASFAGRRWSQLSGGERARTMLAATLAPAPRLVLADEPGASLDMRHRLELLQRLRANSRAALVIVVMHDLDLALRFCDRILLLDRGRLIADDAAHAVAADPLLERTFRLRLQKEHRRPESDWVIGLG